MVLIEEAIKQPKFQYPAQKVAINLLYSSSWLTAEMKAILDPYQISWQQFNILRILKGQKNKPVSLKLLTSRMIDRTSNTSRLIDKLEQKLLVKRISCPSDRRKVEISLTEEGHFILEQASAAMDHQMKEIFNHMSANELNQMSDLLDTMRTPE